MAQANRKSVNEGIFHIIFWHWCLFFVSLYNYSISPLGCQLQSIPSYLINGLVASTTWRGKTRLCFGLFFAYILGKLLTYYTCYDCTTAVILDFIYISSTHSTSFKDKQMNSTLLLALHHQVLRLSNVWCLNRSTIHVRRRKAVIFKPLR